MTEVEQQQQPPPPQNGIDPTAAAAAGTAADDDEENNRARPADIEQDMREMERRKRVEAVMGSHRFRHELERIVEACCENGGGVASGILQQLSDIAGVPIARVNNAFRNSNCTVPINDIRGGESMGYAKGEKILRCKLAATFRLLDLYGWATGLNTLISARLKVDEECFLVNPYGLLFHEVTASSLNKVNMQGDIVEQGTTNFGINKQHFELHSMVHAARPDIRCAIFIACSSVVAVSSLKCGLLPLTRDACVLGEVVSYAYTGFFNEKERNKLVHDLGPNSKVLLLANHGALCCGETIDEAFFAACHIVQACETQLKVLPIGIENLSLIPEESRRLIYEEARRPPESLASKFAAVVSVEENKEQPADAADAAATAAASQKPVTSKTLTWRVGGAEFESLMRLLDNAGFRTGYIYRHPLVKSDPPKPKNDIELPPAVSSLGYILEQEELYGPNFWKKGKGGDRSRWLNSPNVYQKIEVLETGTTDPRKITKWVPGGSPTHSTPVRIEDPLQFVPVGTNPKEFKRLQQQIKDNRRADKISAGPRSHVLEGVTWDEASRIKDANMSQTGDQVVLMGAASKGIIQRGYQHNAAVYKAPYAKNPFDNVTDDEINEYKRTVERKKKSIHGEYTDTDFSESEALTASGHGHTKKHVVCQSEPETELQVSRIETQQAPVPSQAEVVLSDATETLHQLQKQQQHLQYDLKQRNMYLNEKYAFLYDETHGSRHSLMPSIFLVFIIHKIEKFANYTYPVINNSSNDSGIIVNETISIRDELHSSNVAVPQPVTPNFRERPRAYSTPLRADSTTISGNSGTTTVAAAGATRRRCKTSPYRTVSHYGFNYPEHYLPTIALYPSNLVTGVELQRYKVIAYINSSALSFAKRHLHCKKLTEMRTKADLLHYNSDNNEVVVDDGASGDDEDESQQELLRTFPKLARISTTTSDPGARRIHNIDTMQINSSCSECNVCSSANSTGNHHAASSTECTISTPIPLKRTTLQTNINRTPLSARAIDKLANQFSAALSITEPACSVTATKHVTAQDEAFFAKATTSSSSSSSSASALALTAANKRADIYRREVVSDEPQRIPTTPERSTSLYRSYVLHNFVPFKDPSMVYDQTQAQLPQPRRQRQRQAPQSHNKYESKSSRRTTTNSLLSEEGDEHDQHSKAAADQNKQSSSSSKPLKSPILRSGGSAKQIKLMLNTSNQHDITACFSEQLEDDCNNGDVASAANSPIKLFDIHLNVSVRTCQNGGINAPDPNDTNTNAPLQLSAKLEKLIHNEIQLIRQRLSVLQEQELERRRRRKPKQRANAAGQKSVDGGSSQCSFSRNAESSLEEQEEQQLPHYKRMLALLEKELENLLNDIIRASELHKQALICDCKARIIKLQDGLRHEDSSLFNMEQQPDDDDDE